LRAAAAAPASTSRSGDATGSKVPALLLNEVIMNADSRVDDYIGRLPDWQQAVIANNRAGGWRRIQAPPT
jgi:hypothetical protein